MQVHDAGSFGRVIGLAGGVLVPSGCCRRPERGRRRGAALISIVLSPIPRPATALMLPSSLAHDLSLAASPVPAHVLLNGGPRTGKPRGEVSGVRTMTLDGFDEIADKWTPILNAAGFRIELVSVFCHSSPQVTFKASAHPNYTATSTSCQCELADLLIVIDHIDFKGVVDRRAVLVQAKMLKGGALKPSGKEWVQHKLLAWLPVFTFKSSLYNPAARNLRKAPGPKAPTAEYAGIDLSSLAPEWRHELTRKSAPWFHSAIPLADYLANMAVGAPSCGRPAIPGGSDDWSFTVDELLAVTAAQGMTKASKVVRGNPNIVGFVAATSPPSPSFASATPTAVQLAQLLGARESGGGEGGAHGVDEEDAYWPDGPISTVHMTIGRLDEPSTG